MASNSQGMLLPIVGEFPVDPIIRLQPTVQRSSRTANVGWTYRRRCTITNTGSEPIANYPYAIDLGDTTPLTTTKAQADADDVRVWRNGQEVARTLVDWDSGTHTTLCWIVIPYLGAGESQVWDVVYGNASAVSGGVPALALLDDKPAFDIAATGANRSTNAKWIYNVNRVAANGGKGGWGLSTGSAQPSLGWGVPAAWQLVNTLPSDDDRLQEAYSTFVDTSTYYQGRFEAKRARPGSLVVGRNSGADGVSLRNPVGISSVRCDLRWLNLAIGDGDPTPIGKVVILTRNGQAENWATLYSNAALQATEATIATATYTPAAAVKEVAFAVHPYSGANIDPAARPDRYVNAAWYTTLEVNLNSSVITQSLAAEEEIYELATELRHGGGGETTPVPPYKRIYLGNAAEASGKGTPRLACKLNEQVVVDAEKRTVEVWNSGVTAKVENAPIPSVRALDGVLANDGSTVEQVSTEWMPLLPVVNPLTNPSADSNASNWSIVRAATAGMTVSAVSRDTGTSDSSPACFSVTISPNTAAANARIVLAEDTFIPIANQESVSLGMAVRSASANFSPKPTIIFYDKDQADLNVDAFPADWTPTINTWTRRIFSAPIPAGAVYWKAGIRIEDNVGGTTGAVKWDTVEVNDTEIVLRDVSTGTLVMTALWKSRYAFA